MPSPIFNAMNRQPASNPIFSMFGGFNNFQSQFQNFAQQMQGQMNPQMQVQQLLNSGRMTQQQFENIRSIANGIMGTNY